MLPQLLVSGIAIGMLYALIALSMTILYRATTVVNFGHGDLVMVAAYLLTIFAVNATLPFVPALLLSVAVLFAFGFLLHRAFIWPIIRGPHLSLAMMAIAVGYSVRGLVRLEYGQEAVRMPRPFAEKIFFVNNVVITLDEIAFCVVVLVMLVASYVVFSKTRFGRIVQAMFQTQRGASLVGINVMQYNNVIWGVGCALGALGGVLLGLILILDPDVGAWTLLRGFAAMTLGGFGSLHGAVVGGLLIGVLEKVLGTYVSTAFIDITCYLVIIVVLLIRPRGLFGQHATLRV
ncbi:MAG: branched-chain amino acid ABC transporter permease [Ectothiorhodospiraceae bacterium]|nr:branched-chain amino acid ABC transporter permease [Chromatiales bacterium]MCP5155697.1 branched-chain amino acid ABC transporter permease [Ectothiorhodospiraceae bacterium]